VPLNKKGKKIMKSMKDQYGSKRGEQVFYASMNKGKIKGVEKKKNGGLGEKSGPPPKKGPASQGIKLKVAKFRGGGGYQGGRADTPAGAAPAGGVERGGGRDPSAQFKDSKPISSQGRQNLADQRKTARETISPSTKVSSQIAAGLAGAGASMIVPGSGFAVRRGILNRMDATPYWSRDKKTKNDVTPTRDGGDGGQQPIILPTKVASTSTVPIPLMQVQPKTFDFEYKEGGLVRGSGKVLKGKVKKAKIY